MKRYRVAQVGVGPRGIIHVQGFLSLPERFDLVALCDLDEEKLAAVAETHGIAATYTDADQMLAETKPDVFCFVTQPGLRLPMVELAVKHGVRGLAFEKPMASTLKEAWTINALCREHGIKASVCHQHKYTTSLQKLQEIVDGGEIGEVTQIHATALAWLLQLGTHYMDYTLWINKGSPALWAVGHIHGKEMLDDSHPSPDYLMGQVAFENGVRAYLEIGYLAPNQDMDVFWFDDRLTVYGTHGYAWADPDGGWGAFTRSSGGEPVGGRDDGWVIQSRSRLQQLYSADLANWLDDETKVHPSNVDRAYRGYEILEAICLSALDNTRVDLPLEDPEASANIMDRMRAELQSPYDRGIVASEVWTIRK